MKSEELNEPVRAVTWDLEEGSTSMEPTTGGEWVENFVHKQWVQYARALKAQIEKAKTIVKEAGSSESMRAHDFWVRRHEWLTQNGWEEK